MEIRRSEIYRYLGYKRDAVDEQTKKLVEDCLAELEAKAAPSVQIQIFPTLSSAIAPTTGKDNPVSEA